MINLLPTPAYVINKNRLYNNMLIFKHIMDATGVKILLSQKAFSSYYLYPFLSDYLIGTSASGLYEAKLGYEEMYGREVHVYSPAYTAKDLNILIDICDYITFNTPEQWLRFKPVVEKNKNINYGIRINPEYSEIKRPIYNPCMPHSRLGTTLTMLENSFDLLFSNKDNVNISGILFHTMDEQGADTLNRTLDVIENKFKDILRKIRWINFGGGHLITSSKYNISTLINIINNFKSKYNIQVYLEPGMAVALNSGYLLCSVLDIFENGMKIAIVDTSVACHMPNILEASFNPKIINAGFLNEKKYNYRIGGVSCLAGDVIGDYSFDHELRVGDRLILEDMIIYSIVKNNTFNGIPLPSIAIEDENGISVVKKFNYEDYKRRQ